MFFFFFFFLKNFSKATQKNKRTKQQHKKSKFLVYEKMSQIPTEYPAATDEDFTTFVNMADATEGWNEVTSNELVKVWDQKSDKSAINIVKLTAIFNEIEAEVLYDVLHDPEYRAVWDESMIEGFCIEQIDKNNDVGYYSAKAPLGISNRDFVNERSWRANGNKEFIIMNHSVVHPKQPEKKGFVRANSIRTGYLVRVRESGGCTMTWLSQTDPRGWIPAMLSNKATKSFAPRIIEKLEKAAKGYTAWKTQNNPDNKPWRQ
eukprot:TRINITY_DN11446_c0_g1_i1.p1 TRINITY_DN11446_c0_g1~~TRINITY_DN11446_c0_g1_i1.p1  ORF type:complete len:261 (+),score=62.20 TRINITY_DN11446_c0_g1_i1:90-872(+)